MAHTVVDCNTHFGFLPFRDTDVSVGRLLALMDRHGVATALTYSLKGVAYDFEEGNDETLAVCRENPRLLPVATVDPRRYLGVTEEMTKRHREGFLALRVFPESQGWQIDSVMFRPILAELERLNMPLVVPCPSSGSATSILRAVGGSTLPVILCGVGYFNLAEAIAACRENPMLFVEAQIVDTPDALRVAADAIGAERFVFGSNSPSCSMRASLNLVAESELDDEQKSMVFSSNVCRILGIERPVQPTLSLDSPFAGIPIVDIHSHYGKWPFPMRGTGVDYTLQLMRRRNISKTIMSSSYAIVYDFVEGNRLMADAIEGHPELLGYVTVNPNYFDASCRELETYYRKPNFVGAKIHPMYSRQAANSPEIRALVRKIAEYKRPLLIHTYGPGAPSQVLDLAIECPDLPIIMGHGGADAWREAADVVSRTKNLYMEFCCTVHETDKVRRTVEMVGADRVLFGTDLDLIHPGFIAGVYEEAELGRNDAAKILHGNACRLLGLQP